jgi:hypothetical protein
MRAFTTAHPDWLTVIQPPAYAPDLNPVEGAWSVMKNSQGNRAPRHHRPARRRDAPPARPHPATTRPHRRLPRPDRAHHRPPATVDPGLSTSVVAASYCSTTLAGMRPRSLTAILCSLAHARMPPPGSRPDAVRPGRRRGPRPALRACAMNGANCWRNATALLALRSISYCAPLIPNRSVSSAGPPSRSSSSATVTFCATPASPALVSDISPYKINRHAAGTATPIPCGNPACGPELLLSSGTAQASAPG